MKMMAMMTPSCEIVTRQISESYDRKLSLRERIGIRVHTFGCILCERYRLQLMAIHRLLQKYSENVDQARPDVVLPEEAKQMIKQKLHEFSK